VKHLNEHHVRQRNNNSDVTFHSGYAVKCLRGEFIDIFIMEH